MRAITITTGNYVLNALRLCRSLKRVHPLCVVTVYVDDSSLAAIFAPIGCETKLLPEIKQLGVKRAKFFAYADAIKAGGFLYLDADIIVLQKLEELFAHDDLVACRDRLTECTYIANPARPWINRPELCGDTYFNSGVFYAPGRLQSFFDDCLESAKKDAEWEALIIPTKLYDNHFLCAKIAECGLDVKFVSEYQFNWQGFRSGNQLKVRVDTAGNLYNIDENKLLKLVHFASIQEIDNYIFRLPMNIQAILARAVGYNYLGVLEHINSSLWQLSKLEDSTKQILLRPLLTEPEAIDRGLFYPGAERPFITDALPLKSIAMGAISDDFLWNGLACGSAYLNANEYYTLREFIQAHKLTRIFEVGAGYTSVLFNSIAAQVISIEGWRGPRLDFAVQQGCDARVIPFIPEQGGFESAGLQTILAEFQQPVQMIFIDSPQDTTNRLLVAEQLVQITPHADYYVLHDSLRDAAVIYKLCCDLNLEIVAHKDSIRGLTFLAKKGLEKLQTAFSANAGSVSDINLHAVKFAVAIKNSAVSASDLTKINLSIKLKNNGLATIPFATAGLFFSYHLLNSDGESIVWDFPRYQLPVDLEPEDEVVFNMYIDRDDALKGIIAFDLVQEGVAWWSRLTGAKCPIFDLRINIGVI